MIVTLTAHPALDRTLTLDTALRPDQVQSASSDRLDAGGKGINVSRAVDAAGLGTVAVVPAAPNDPLVSLLSEIGLPTATVSVSGTTRTNLTLVDAERHTTKINTPGARIDDSVEAALIETLIERCTDARWLVLAGSLPPGTDERFYVRIIHALREARPNLRIAVDTSGPALAAVVADGWPDLIKPNDEELASLVGATLADGDSDAAIRHAQQLVPDQVGAVLLTLGSEGATLVTSEVALRARAPKITVASTVGAGDSSLAGYLIAESRGESPEERLRLAVAYGSLAATLPGTQPPTAEHLPDWDIPVTTIP